MGKESDDITANKRRLDPEDLKKPDRIAEVQTVKSRRDELFRDFENHPRKLALAREIKDFDDQIADLSTGKTKASNATLQVQACAKH